jgi:beta-aspartyl-peptidase (threonine type)
MHVLVIHGGAGVVPARIGDTQPQYEASLGGILDAAFEILHRGGSSLDAVTVAVRMLEDDPLFNAGYGAGLARDGSAELDASIMDGRNCAAGAVACVKHVKNPVELARRVMEKSRHVLLVGSGAEEFALEEGMTLTPNQYFRTQARIQQLENQQRGVGLPEVLPGSQGTVGAVALDVQGNLAAATSTGGLTNKLPGRVGDSPIIGAGTYAKNGVCAVSGTGQGEYFIRAVAAYHIAAAVEYRGLSLAEAVRELVHVSLPELGGLGGIIAVDAAGEIAMDFNTEGMFRGARDANGQRTIACRTLRSY